MTSIHRAMLTMSLLAAWGCGDPGPDLGTRLTSSTQSANQLLLSADGSKVITVWSDATTHETALVTYDPVTSERVVVYSSKDPSWYPSYLHRANDGALFFLEMLPPEITTSPWTDDVISEKHLGVLVRVSPDGTDVRTLGKCEMSNFAEIAVSPDGRRVACADEDHSVALIDVGTGVAQALNDRGVAIAFSPDGREVLVGEGQGFDTDAGGLTATLARVSTVDVRAAPIPVTYRGLELLGARWDQNGLVALTRTGDGIWLEDLLAGSVRVLWQEPQGARMAYEWADADRVFQLTGGKCLEYKSWFEAECKRGSFDLALRSLSTGEQRHLANGEGARGGDAVLMADGHHFVWIVDDQLYVHDM